MKLDNIGENLITTATFAGVGLAVFAVAFYLMTKLAPFSVKKRMARA